MTEADAERERNERDGEHDDRVSERGGHQTDGRANQPEDERRLVADPAHDWTDHAALNDGAEHAERGKEISRARRVESKSPRGEQRERRLEYGERTPVHEIDDQDAADDRAREQRRQETERVARARLRPMDRFRQPQQRHRGRHCRECGRRPDRRRVAHFREHAAQCRPCDETEAEGRADESICARAIFRFRDVRHVRARRRDVAARQAVDDPRSKQHRDAVRDGKHHEADHGAGQAEDQDRPAAVAIRQVAERGRRRELTERKHREQQADDERRGAKGLGVERQQRDDDPEADEIHKNCQKDDDERACHKAGIILYNQRR